VSGTTENLSRKISTAQDLAAVVRSMKALAASSIGQYESAVVALHDYYRTVELALSVCLRNMAPPGEQEGEQASVGSPVAARVEAPVGTPVRKIGAIVFGSDQGLVGRFNEVLIDFARAELRTLPGTLTRMWAVGERMQALIPAPLIAAPQAWPVPASVDAITPLVGRILIDIGAARERGDIAELHVFHNRPRTAAVCEPAGRRLLPLDAAWRGGMAAVPWPMRSPPQVIDPAAPALEAFIREYLFVVLFQSCAESLAAENASRLAAMQRAEKNIREILEDLKGQYRRLRQESIDEELFEVIAGYESLTHDSGRTIR
jgi:F-type H+-transporting ATPase subunit gamma